MNAGETGRSGLSRNSLTAKGGIVLSGARDSCKALAARFGKAQFKTRREQLLALRQREFAAKAPADLLDSIARAPREPETTPVNFRELRNVRGASAPLEPAAAGTAAMRLPVSRPMLVPAMQTMTAAAAPPVAHGWATDALPVLARLEAALRHLLDSDGFFHVWVFGLAAFSIVLTAIALFSI
jgi:hypothetical protein